ncbi:MAG: transglutaminase family protein, partial [Candidatus Hodarchaeota archaeon]
NSRIENLASWSGLQILEEYLVDCRAVRMSLTFNTNTPHTSVLSYNVQYVGENINTLLDHSLGINDYSSSFIPNWNRVSDLYLQLPEGSELPEGVRTYEQWAPTATAFANQLMRYPTKVSAQAYVVMRNLSLTYGFDDDMWLGNYLEGQTPHPDTGEDYVEWFLADHQKGVSAHFASALVMILRLQGIPSRIATGWVIGNQTDPTVDEREITAIFTHSWVEVLIPLEIPGVGRTFQWVIYDADPRAGSYYDLPPDVMSSDALILYIQDSFNPVSPREIFPGQQVNFFVGAYDIISNSTIAGVDVNFYLRGTDAGRDIYLGTVQTSQAGVATYPFVYDISQHTGGSGVTIYANATADVRGIPSRADTESDPFNLRINRKTGNTRSKPIANFPNIGYIKTVRSCLDYFSNPQFQSFELLCICTSGISFYLLKKDFFFHN